MSGDRSRLMDAVLTDRILDSVRSPAACLIERRQAERPDPLIGAEAIHRAWSHHPALPACCGWRDRFAGAARMRKRHVWVVAGQGTPEWAHRIEERGRSRSAGRRPRRHRRRRRRLGAVQLAQPGGTGARARSVARQRGKETSACRRRPGARFSGLADDSVDVFVSARRSNT